MVGIIDGISHDDAGAGPAVWFGLPLLPWSFDISYVGCGSE